MVYVISKNGKPLMPTKRYGKVKHMLKDGRAKVVKRTPFTIQLQYDTTEYTQPVTLGVDAGSKTIGLSATTEDKELYSGEVELRNDISQKLERRSEVRRSRRNRKTRYRKPRFDNRRRADGWLAPSVRQKINAHLNTIDSVYKILPIAKINIEVASFDVQKIKNPNIESTEYQQGEQLGFWNVREYVLYRDNHKCQCCHGKSKDKRLEVHHIESRQMGGNAPNNLITLCKTCHDGYHNGTVKLPKTIHRGMSFRDATFMGIMRWALYDKLKETYDNVHLTYGYITKNTRIQNKLPKTHYVDARCISGHPNVEPLGYYYYQKKVRCHNRQLYKANTLKGSIRKRNQAERIVKGFKLFDKVSYKNEECFIFGRRTTGQFDVRKLDGTKVSASVSYKKFKLLESAKHYLTEKRFQTAEAV